MRFRSMQAAYTETPVHSLRALVMSIPAKAKVLPWQSKHILSPRRLTLTCKMWTARVQTHEANCAYWLMVRSSSLVRHRWGVALDVERGGLDVRRAGIRFLNFGAREKVVRDEGRKPECY